jgi:hypothetical protein
MILPALQLPHPELPAEPEPTPAGREDASSFRREVPFAAAVGALSGGIYGAVVMAELLHLEALPFPTGERALVLGILLLVYGGGGAAFATVGTTAALAIARLFRRTPGTGLVRGSLLGSLSFLLLLRIAIEPDAPATSGFGALEALGWGLFVFLDSVVSLVLFRISRAYYDRGLQGRKPGRKRALWIATAAAMTGLGLLAVVGLPGEMTGAGTSAAAAAVPTAPPYHCRFLSRDLPARTADPPLSLLPQILSLLTHWGVFERTGPGMTDAHRPLPPPGEERW